MTAHNTSSNDEAQIHDLIQERVAALRAKDSSALTARYAKTVVLYDVVGPLRHVGSDAEAERVREWLSSYRGPIGYEVRDLEVAARNDVAFCHFLYRVSGVMTEGTEVNMWVRSTVCFQRIDGAWTITHEHSSVPFDATTGAASVNLQP